MIAELSSAWDRREKAGAHPHTNARRVFHGPGEGKLFSQFAIDLFDAYAWVTFWQRPGALEADARLLGGIRDFLLAKNMKAAVLLNRPEKGVPEDAGPLFGEIPKARFPVFESQMKYLIQLAGTKHPGLFLDHAPLRTWLAENSRGKKVLNTFAYTGSLSVAAARGDASFVTTLDLSKATIDWARENWKLNELSESSANFIAGDVFEWLPRLLRKKDFYDLIILDPPSFSRSKSGSFSTARDLKKLHTQAFELLVPQGILATSINSSKVSWDQYQAEVWSAARDRKTDLKVLEKIELPPSFPTRPDQRKEKYLKGWILQTSHIGG